MSDKVRGRERGWPVYREETVHGAHTANGFWEQLEESIEDDLRAQERAVDAAIALRQLKERHRLHLSDGGQRSEQATGSDE